MARPQYPMKKLTPMLLILVAVCEAKNSYGTFRLSTSQWRTEIGKFAFSKGLGKIAGNFSTKGYADFHGDHAAPVQLLLFVDTQYNGAKECADAGGCTCSDFSSRSVGRMGMTTPSSEHEKFNARLAGSFPPSLTPMNDPPNKSIYRHVWDSIENVMRPHYWYVVAVDCRLDQPDREALSEELLAPQPLVYYSLDMLNEAPRKDPSKPIEYTHIPQDEEGMRPALVSCMVFLLAFGTLFVIMAAQQSFAKGTVHMVLLLLGAAIVLQTAFVVMEFAHLSRYMEDGRGFRLRHSWLAFDFFGEAAQALSSLIVSIVLVALACGWTITTGSLEGALPSSTMLERMHLQVLQHMRRPGDMFDSWNVTNLSLLGLCAMHVLLVLYGVGGEEDFDQFHNHQHWPGKLLLLCRMLLFGLFASAGRRLFRSVGVEGKTALLAIGCLGTAYFLGFPVLVLVSTVVAEYWRHRFVTVGALMIQSFALVALGYMFLGQSEYSKVSTLRTQGAGLPSSFLSARPRKNSFDKIKEKIALD